MTYSRQGIKNYKARAASMQGYSQKIQYALSRVGAKRVFFEYGGQGELVGIGFVVATPGGEFPVSLPARVDKVAQIMYGDSLGNLPETKRTQAYTTAWANIKDWVESQCALIETEMVRVEEVFLPYVEVKGKRFFEHIEDTGFNQLGSGAEEGTVENE